MSLNDPEDCPKYQDCRAPVCPLDPTCLHTQHMRDEPVCFYLREYVKDTQKTESWVGTDGAKWLSLLSDLTPRIMALYPDIKRQLERSKKTGVRLGVKVGL